MTTPLHPDLHELARREARRLQALAVADALERAWHAVRAAWPRQLAAKVLQPSMRPPSSPRLNQLMRCSAEPCVNVSGTTRP